MPDIMIEVFDWDDLYNRALDKPFGSIELTAKDEARDFFRWEILEKEGYDIEKCECPEEEIDAFIEKSSVEYLFDFKGNHIEYDGQIYKI